MSKKTSAIILVSFVVICGLFLFSLKKSDLAPMSTDISNKAGLERIESVLLGDVTIHVDVAQTEKEKEQGLSGIEVLPQNEGKLFIFDVPDTYGIWMKEMRFPIDIIWIDSSFSIVSIKTKALPESYPAVFMPEKPAQYVLEVNAGFAKQHMLEVGSKVIFK